MERNVSEIKILVQEANESAQEFAIRLTHNMEDIHAIHPDILIETSFTATANGRSTCYMKYMFRYKL